MRIRLLLAAVLVSLFAATPVSAQTGMADPSADMLAAEDITVELPVLGTTLTVTISTDATTGDVSAEVTAADGDVAGADLAAGFTVHIDSESNGYEVSLENHDAGVEAEIDVMVADDGTSNVTEVEVEGYSPQAIAGAGSWTGDPIGLGLHSATILYTVTVADSGEPSISIDSVAVDADVTWSLPDAITHFEADENEYGLQQSVWFDYFDGTDWVQTSVIFMIEVEDGESELEIVVDNPATQSASDHDEADSHDEDDDHDEHDSSDDDDDDEHDRHDEDDDHDEHDD